MVAALLFSNQKHFEDISGMRLPSKPVLPRPFQWTKTSAVSLVSALKKSHPGTPPTTIIVRINQTKATQQRQKKKLKIHSIIFVVVASNQKGISCYLLKLQIPINTEVCQCPKQ